MKLASVLFLIFVFAPYVAGREGQPASAGVECPLGLAPSCAGALASTLKGYAKSFWIVFRAGFPLMLLAALLGALVIELVSPHAINVPVSAAGIVLVALIGAFLPVPMAFDVVIAYIAMSRGVPLPHVGVLVRTLGIYRRYSAAVIGKTISWKVAMATYAAVAFLGVVAGIATSVFI